MGGAGEQGEYESVGRVAGGRDGDGSNGVGAGGQGEYGSSEGVAGGKMSMGVVWEELKGKVSTGVLVGS